MSGTDSARWAKIRKLFKQAMTLPEAERDAFIREKCGDDAELESELRTLLATDDDAGLSRIVAGAAASAAGGSQDPLLGQRVGNYELVDVLGTGGMARVYLGRRADEEFEHEVAIKVLQAGAANEHFVQRFRAERQVLANLDHPNIAKLLDGGITDDGLPFLVMEYVRGMPVDTWCDEKRLTIRERLELFRKICLAVDYAHRNLVVHRDVKPSNVLVTDDGNPKLLDFGIAKVLDASRADQPVTMDSQRLLTPEYASPEQVRGEPVSVATDVYSLGVLLYRLLCGRGPYRPQSDLPSGLAQAILEDSPSRPSTLVTRPPDDDDETTDPEAISARRSSTATRLRKRLRGDLDKITLMALRKEPERRYASARQFADDIANYLEDRPVIASVDSLGYRAAKFVRRNAVGVVSAVLVVAVIGTLVAYYTWQLALERDRALTEARTAARVSDFVVTLFDAANPAHNNPDEITPKSLLDRGRERIDTELADAPAIRARLLGVLSEGYRVLGDYETSEPLAQASLELIAEHQGDNDVAIAVAKLRLARNNASTGNWQDARALFEDLLPVLRSAEDTEPRALAGALLSYGNVLRQLGEYDAAEQVFREVVALTERADDVPAYVRGSGLGNIGIVMEKRGQNLEAVDYLEQAAEIYRADPTTPRHEAAALYNSLGNAYRNVDRFDEAIELMDKALETYVEGLGENHANVAGVHLARSSVLKHVGRIADARADISAARSIFEKTLGPDHPNYGLGHHYLATHYWRYEDRLDEAYELYGKALAVYRNALKADHPYIVFALNAQGGIRNDQERYEEAEALLLEALDRAKRSMAPGHDQIRYAYIELGINKHGSGELEAAREYFQTAVDLIRDDGTPVRSGALLLNSYADLLDDLGEHEQAEALRAEAAGED